MNDDAIIEVILAEKGIYPSDPRYAAYKAAIKAQMEANITSQGRQFDEGVRQFDTTSGINANKVSNDYAIASRNLDVQRQDVNNRYEIAKLGVQTERERLALERWKAEKDEALSRERLALDAELGRGKLDIDRGTQGLGLLREDVALRQAPRSWTALADYEAGLAANPFAVGSIQALLGNAAASAGSNAPGSTRRVGLPEQGGLQAVLGKLGIGQAGSDQTNAAQQAATSGAQQPTPDAKSDPRVAGIQAVAKNYVPSGSEGWDAKDVATIRAIMSLAGIGEQKYANKYAQMDKDDQDILLGGMGRLGRNPERVARSLDQYRVGNSASGLAA